VAAVWVCLCEAVTSGTIIEAVQAGADTVKGVGQVSGAGTVCGKCAPTIRLLIEQHRDRAEANGKERRA
jgi:bacterioferritin-associated ferredoxin